MAKGVRTGGRAKGTPNKATAAKAKAIEESGLTPLDYMLSIMRDETKPEVVRFEAAKAAAPYVHPKLAATAVLGEGDGSDITITWRTEDSGGDPMRRRSALALLLAPARYGTWADDPRHALQREIEWERGGAYFRARTDRGCQLSDELVAIERLVAAHREEFDAVLIEIAERRAWNEKKAAMAQSKPKPNPRGSL